MSDTEFVPLFDAPTDRSNAFMPWAEPSVGTMAAPADEFERGLAEGQALAEAAFAEERKRLQALVAAANALQPVEPESLRALICRTVERLVREIVGATPVDHDLLHQQIAEAVHFAGAVGNDSVLRLSPDDMALLADAALPLDIVVDPSLAPGTLRVETQSVTVEHGRAVRLEALSLQLGGREDGACR